MLPLFISSLLLNLNKLKKIYIKKKIPRKNLRKASPKPRIGAAFSNLILTVRRGRAEGGRNQGEKGANLINSKMWFALFTRGKLESIWRKALFCRGIFGVTDCLHCFDLKTRLLRRLRDNFLKGRPPCAPPLPPRRPHGGRGTVEGWPKIRIKERIPSAHPPLALSKSL